MNKINLYICDNINHKNIQLNEMINKYTNSKITIIIVDNRTYKTCEYLFQIDHKIAKFDVIIFDNIMVFKDYDIFFHKWLNMGKNMEIFALSSEYNNMTILPYINNMIFFSNDKLNRYSLKNNNIKNDKNNFLDFVKIFANENDISLTNENINNIMKIYNMYGIKDIVIYVDILKLAFQMTDINARHFKTLCHM
jgi:hypothetical protein